MGCALANSSSNVNHKEESITQTQFVLASKLASSIGTNSFAKRAMPQVEETPVQDPLAEVMPMFEQADFIINQGKNSLTSKKETSDLEEYENKEVIGFKDVDGTDKEVTLYYNVTFNEEVEEDRYADDTYTIYCQCSCGEEFVTNFGAIKNGQYRCLKCSNSKSNIEAKVEMWLKKKHIDYEYQKRFEECKVKRCLPFDFYLSKYNCCIEVDGRQHEIVSKFGNETDEEAIENLAKRKKYDEIKTKFCEDNNIKLIRIPEDTVKGRHEEYKKILYENLIKK